MLKRTIEAVSPAKINLYLGVGKRRDDGFHDVDDVLHAIALNDTVIVKLNDGRTDADPQIVLTCTPEVDCPPQDNLVYRAVQGFMTEFGVGLGDDEYLQIAVEKRIPQRAGLGGGSSDAAAALVAMARLFDVDTHDERLVQVAKGLGSDVPFFLEGGCVHMTGKGDTLVERFIPLDMPLIVLKADDGGIAAGDAYRAFDEDPVTATGLPRMLSALRSDEPGRAERAAEALYNNLEGAARKLAPSVGELLDMWRFVPLFPGCLLSGSGSAVFVICDGEDIAKGVADDLSAEGTWTCATVTCDYGAHVVADDA